LLKSLDWSGDINGTLAWTYNNDFNVTSQSINGGNSINFSYDNDQLLVQAGGLTLIRDTQKGGLINATSLGLQTTAHSYTAFGELQDSTANYNGTEQLRVQYSRDKLGRIVSKTETLDGGTHVEQYSYDNAGRLIEVKRDNVILASYQYDANGNRTHVSGALVGNYDDQDRLVSYQGKTYTYTDNGELKTKTQSGVTTQYNYDVLGNLRHVDLGGTSIDYLIDAQNRRIGKKVNGVLQQVFLYQNQLQPVAELDGNNNIVARFVYADKGNIPSYMIKGGITYRIIRVLSNNR
jgi:YD repeat-containing protein